MGWQCKICKAVSRRQEIINQSPSMEDLKARWPALFEIPHIVDEFLRITTLSLEATFMSKLDEYTPSLMDLFNTKGGAMGVKLQAILLTSPSNPDINKTREVIIRCLMVYLGEDTGLLLKVYDHADDPVAEDLDLTKMAIYSIRATSEGPSDVGIVIDGIKVVRNVGNFARACAILIGLTYVVNLAYPKELKYTFEFFQKVLLQLDSLKLTPKVHSLKKEIA